jgi:ferredoxin
MKTTIYYFSGTGNSLAVAAALARELQDPVEIVPLAARMKQRRIEVRADVLGFVCPTHFLTIPGIVKSFVGKLSLDSAPYIFSVVTCNSQPGRGLFVMDRLFRRKGQSMKLGCAVDMPGNSLIGMDFTNPPEVRSERLNNSRETIRRIARAVRERQASAPEGTDSPGVRLRSLLMRSFVRHIYRPAGAFRTGESCSRCGTCARVCPVGNIAPGESGPEWGDKCLYCLACLHWCPRHAIEMKRDTVGRLRYHHPDITADQIAAQSGVR